VSVGDKVGPLIKEDFLKQDVARLDAWFERFPEACELLELSLGQASLKYAMRENMWLSTMFLLGCDSVPRKVLQIHTGVDNPHEICQHIIKSHIQNSPSSQHHVLSGLYSLVRL
jgi:hypothetical protein